MDLTTCSQRKDIFIILLLRNKTNINDYCLI
jgi:hypothetical protein